MVDADASPDLAPDVGAGAYAAGALNTAYCQFRGTAGVQQVEGVRFGLQHMPGLGDAYVVTL